MTRRPTCAEIAANWELWQEYADPNATMTRQEFGDLYVEEKIAMLHEMFPADCTCEERKMATLIVTFDPAVDDPQLIGWQQGYEWCFEGEDWTDEGHIVTYTIPDDDTPAWLEQALNANPDVIEYSIEA